MIPILGGGCRGGIRRDVVLLLQAPKLDALGRPLRWFLTEMAKACHTVRGRRGHFWERRYRFGLIEDDPYALAALRYLDRNPGRAGLVAEPPTSPWSSCAAYALGTPNRVVTFHPSYLGLRRYATVRQRQYRRLLTPRADPRADGRDPCWSTQRAVGSPAFVAPYVPRRRGRPKSGTRPSQNQAVRPKMVSGTFFGLSTGTFGRLQNGGCHAKAVGTSV